MDQKLGRDLKSSMRLEILQVVGLILGLPFKPSIGEYSFRNESNCLGIPERYIGQGSR